MTNRNVCVNEITVQKKTKLDLKKSTRVLLIEKWYHAHSQEGDEELSIFFDTQSHFS